MIYEEKVKFMVVSVRVGGEKRENNIVIVCECARIAGSKQEGS